MDVYKWTRQDDVQVVQHKGQNLWTGSTGVNLGIIWNSKDSQDSKWVVISALSLPSLCLFLLLLVSGTFAAAEEYAEQVEEESGTTSLDELPTKDPAAVGTKRKRTSRTFLDENENAPSGT